jgi:hypothetical protein
MYTNPLLELNASWIPVFEWSVVQDDKEAKSLRGGWGISDEWTIVATDILGDIIVVKSDVLYSINHEDLTATRLAPSLTALLGPLAELCKVGEHSEDTPLPDLKEKKALLTELKKCFKGTFLHDNFEDEIEELREFISDWKFYQTDRGKIWLEMNRFQKIYLTAIGQPSRYGKVSAVVEPAQLRFVVAGYISRNGESIAELKQIAEDIPHGFQIDFSLLFPDKGAFAEYLRTKEEERAHRNAQRPDGLT